MILTKDTFHEVVLESEHKWLIAAVTKYAASPRCGVPLL